MHSFIDLDRTLGSQLVRLGARLARLDVGRIDGLARTGVEPRRFRNRNEREFAGYRDAIDEIMRATALEPISVPYILHLHRQLFRFTDGGGGRPGPAGHR